MENVLQFILANKLPLACKTVIAICINSPCGYQRKEENKIEKQRSQWLYYFTYEGMD